jgi:Integrase core domain
MLRTGQLPSVQNTVHCNECVLGKQHRHPFHGSIATATRPGDVINSDVVGPLRPSHSGSCYLVMFVDEFTRYVTIFALIRKSAVLDSFKVFHREFERLHTTTIKAIHSDNGGSTHQSPHMLYNLAFPYIALPRTLRSPIALLNAKIDPYSKWLALH